MSTTSGIELPVSNFTTARQLKYHYIHVPPKTPPSPYVLILHGFPSVPTDFIHQITHLANLGYGIIGPYLLGYSPTSTPGDPSAYRLKLMCKDLISLLDHINVSAPVHAIGHDWGATLLSRLEYYHPDRLLKVAYITIAPVPFGQSFDLDQVNRMTKEHLGYEGFGYQKFIINGYENGHAARLLGEKHERMEMLMFAEDAASMWRENFARLDGLENWLRGNDEAKMVHGVTRADLDRRRRTFRGTKGRALDADGGPIAGYAGAIMWYVSHNRNLNVDDEKSERQDWHNYTTARDVLLVLCDKDPVSIPAIHEGMARAYVEDASKQLRTKHLWSGHFVMYEQADELNDSLGTFFAE